MNANKPEPVFIPCGDSLEKMDEIGDWQKETACADACTQPRTEMPCGTMPAEMNPDPANKK